MHVNDPVLNDYMTIVEVGQVTGHKEVSVPFHKISFPFVILPFKMYSSIPIAFFWVMFYRIFLVQSY